ncbi:hypothetical protein GCM10008015_11460 [Flavobacterium palustre]|uniref:Uncharacterized protein n=1 Tax=Flavobacterium palustre TaxID=1476463 RepID=A0ABQ1HDI8_9FLAO|nr:DUF6155 family protein [Flavobacterium palustre]GGA72498.1 hypothetical protein GCM10008015_11460 [Flavobacterium palustre]
MSKRDLKKYLGELDKEQLQEQLIELYEKFTAVKEYYDFVFNPKEEKRLQEAKLKISNEYFPIGKTRKAKMRRSTAQKIIKHFITLGVDPFVTADVMLYTIEIAQTFSAENSIKQEAFYKSMHNSFDQAVQFLIANGILSEFKRRINAIYDEILQQKWKNSSDFLLIMERIS